MDENVRYFKHQETGQIIKALLVEGGDGEVQVLGGTMYPYELAEIGWEETSNPPLYLGMPGTGERGGEDA